MRLQDGKVTTRHYAIIEIAKFAKDLGINSGLPTSRPGVASRAESQNWEFEIVPGKGGKNGEKKLYTIPDYVIEELEQKGLLHLIDGAETDAPLEVRNTQPDVPHLENMDYADWAARQDTRDIVPVRYYKEVFASARQRRNTVGHRPRSPCGSEPPSSNTCSSPPQTASVPVSTGTACFQP